MTVIGCKNYRVIEPDYDLSSTQYYVETTDEAAKATQLPVLRELPLGDELTEIRIWVGFGPLILEQFFSIKISEEVNGRLIWYFYPRWSQWTEQDYHEFQDDFYQFCDKLGTFNETEACVDTDYVFDWNAIYKELIDLDIWNIPDESEVPKYVEKDLIARVDGTSIVVELKKPGYYRSFSYRYETYPIKEKYLYGNKILEIIHKHTK